MREKARENGVSEARAVHVARAESRFVYDAKGDMDITCYNPGTPFHGEPVEARGTWQITKCYYPDVPDDVAYDPIASTDFVFANRLLEEGTCQEQFSTCR